MVSHSSTGSTFSHGSFGAHATAVPEQTSYEYDTHTSPSAQFTSDVHGVGGGGSQYEYDSLVHPDTQFGSAGSQSVQTPTLIDSHEKPVGQSASTVHSPLGITSGGVSSCARAGTAQQHARTNNTRVNAFMENLKADVATTH
jgi:hypothetical protein